MVKDKNQTPLAATLATNATRGANEWGIPDWRDAAAYGDVTRWGFNRWRWEFYRRRDDLRCVFDIHAQDSFARWKRYSQGERNIHYAWWCVYARDIGVTSPPEPTEAGFVAFIPEPVANLFGYFRLPNPRISNQPDSCIIPSEDDGTVKYVIGADTDTLEDRIKKYGVNIPSRDEILLRDIMKHTPTPIENNEVAIVFCLGKPLAPQIKVAKRNLTELQKTIFSKPIQKRRNGKKWLGYLRTLDARADGASWAKITKVFFAEGLIDRRKSPSGGYRAPDPQAARDMWQAADALRFNF